MGEREPLRQLSCGLIGSRSVKRHHGRRDAWHPQQLCAPAVTDEHDLYEVRAPADGFFEVVNGHGAINERRGNSGRSYASAAADQAKRDTKAVSTRSGTRSVEASSGKKISCSRFSTAFARVINNFCTTRVLTGVLRGMVHLDGEVTMRHRAGYL